MTRQIDLARVLPHARIAELPNPYFGKVRDCYDLPDQTRILISSDRISAFDRILAAIPFKGQVLTQTARYWFNQTADICPNHVVSYPDPNVVIGKHVTILPVEIVVRGYLAGTTSTSILTQYKAGARQMYGHTLPEGYGVNRNGEPTRDPAAILDGGALLPFGGYKGSALSMMVELLAAALTGGNFSFDFDWSQHPGAKTPWTGELLIVIDPSKGAGSNFAQRTEKLVKEMHDAGQNRQPGDRRYRQRAESSRVGIAIDTSELAKLRALAGEG